MKVKDIKKKVAAKVAKGKAKVAKKCGKAEELPLKAGDVFTTPDGRKWKYAGDGVAKLLSLVALLALCGCQNPAQRAQTAETKQIFNIYEGSTANFTFGSEFVSLAQSNETGGNDAGLTASPTTDVKPEIAVGVGGSSAGTGKGGGTTTQSGKFATIGAGVDAAASLVPSGDDNTEAQPVTQPVAKSECEGGECTPCKDGACEYTGE